MKCMKNVCNNIIISEWCYSINQDSAMDVVALEAGWMIFRHRTHVCVCTCVCAWGSQWEGMYSVMWSLHDHHSELYPLTYWPLSACCADWGHEYETVRSSAGPTNASTPNKTHTHTYTNAHAHTHSSCSTARPDAAYSNCQWVRESVQCTSPESHWMFPG